MSEESTKVIADIKRLETRIENLRWTVIILIIIVSLLSIYVVFQLISLSPILSAFGFIVILCFFLLYKECAKMRVAPPPGFEPGSQEVCFKRQPLGLTVLNANRTTLQGHPFDCVKSDFLLNLSEQPT